MQKLQSKVDQAVAEQTANTDYSPEARALVAEAVGRVLQKDVEVDFREDPELECGIVLVIGSRHIGWTLGEYLDALENDVAGLLDARADPEAEA